MPMVIFPVSYWDQPCASVAMARRRQRSPRLASLLSSSSSTSSRRKISSSSCSVARRHNKDQRRPPPQALETRPLLVVVPPLSVRSTLAAAAVSPLEQLPHDVLQSILLFLPIDEVDGAVKLVSKTFW